MNGPPASSGIHGTPWSVAHSGNSCEAYRLVLPGALTDHYIGRTGVNWKAFEAIGFQSARERTVMGMIDEVYNKKILEFAGNIPRIGRLAQPDATARAHSKLCGSTVTVDLCMRDGMVTDFAHDVKACALGQASSSIMARNIIGSTAEELRAVRETMQKMLRENGPPPQGRFADLRYLEPVRDYRARHASTLLTFDAVVDAISQIEKKQAEAVA